MNTYRVLIADDEESIQRILTRICHSLNWQTDTASDGVEALDLMEKNEYQIFTVDVNMPGPSGLELSRTILEKYDSPAILILTGYAEITQAVEATKEGVYNYIQKDNVEINDIREHLLKAANYHENLLRSSQARTQRESEILDAETASKQFQAVFDLSSDMTWIAETKTLQITDCNHAVCERLGYTRSEILQLKLSHFVPSITKENLHGLFASSEQGYVKESSIETKNAETIPIDISYTHICLTHGEFISVMMRDISERKEMQAQILHERNLLHLLMDNIPDSIFFKDAELKYTCINQAYASKLNLSSPTQVINKTDQDVLPLTEAHRNEREDQMLLNSKQPLINKVIETLFPDGSKKWYAVTKVPILNSAQSADGLIGISRDISSIKHAELKILKTTQELERKVVELDSIMDGLPIGVILTNERSTIIQVNQWIETWLNVPKEFLVEMPITEVFRENLNVNIEQQLQSLAKLDEIDEPDEIETKIEFLESEYNVCMKPVISEDTFLGVAVFINEVTEKTQMQDTDMQDTDMQDTESLSADSLP